MKDEGGVASEGKLVSGIPKFYGWGKCTMPLAYIRSEWMSTASSGLSINKLHANPFNNLHLGVQ